MPTYRRRSYARRRPARRGYRRTAFKSRTSRWSKRSNISRTGYKRFFKLRTTRALSSDTNGDIDLIVQPSIANSLDEFAAIGELFDVAKCAAIKIKYIPDIPNSTSAQFSPMYVVGDSTDGITPITDATAIQYDNLQVKNLYRPWTYYYYLPKRGNTALMGGYEEIDVSGGLTGDHSIKLHGSGYNSTITLYGIVVITFYIVAKNRR